VTLERLSALDASFLAVESPAAPMHVGWVSSFDDPDEGPRPSFDDVFEHLAGRFAQAPRWQRKLAPVPLALTEPAWVDDPDFDPADHILHARGDDLDAIVDDIFSEPLPRDRPLWQMWIADELEDGVALIGKAHHCMVDGIAIVELGKLILDADPDAAQSHAAPSQDASPAASVAPSRLESLARALADRAADGAAIAAAPLKLATSPGRLRGVPELARMASHTLLPPAPESPLNLPGSPRRRHVRMSRPLDELRTLRKRFRVTPNDIVLAVCAGALRNYAGPQRLKVMVPADVRGAGDDEAGNRISFVFFELPCDEPDPVARLEAVHEATSGRAGDGEGLDATLRALSLAPTSVKRVLAHAFAHPRMSNLTISSVPGPATARFMHGCRLREVHSAVPLAERHALSIGVVMTAGRVCFGIYADAETLPDADALRDELDASFDELLSA
jgi:diacylglycerol O-acyltransferase / wax synthase